LYDQPDAHPSASLRDAPVGYGWAGWAKCLGSGRSVAHMGARTPGDGGSGCDTLRLGPSLRRGDVMDYVKVKATFEVTVEFIVPEQGELRPAPGREVERRVRHAIERSTGNLATTVRPVSTKVREKVTRAGLSR
jgi:hypothetical protein